PCLMPHWLPPYVLVPLPDKPPDCSCLRLQIQNRQEGVKPSSLRSPTGIFRGAIRTADRLLPSAGLRLSPTLALEIERHGCTDEILQRRLIDLLVLADVDG